MKQDQVKWKTCFVRHVLFVYYAYPFLSFSCFYIALES